MVKIQLPPAGQYSVAVNIDELLAELPGVRFNLDVKEPNAIGPFVDTMRKVGAWTRINVASFSNERLVRVRRLAGPRLATALSPREVIQLRLSTLGLPNLWQPPAAACIQIPVQFAGHVLAEPRLIEAAHQLDLQVHVWTVDDPEEMQRMLDLGVDGIISDRPTTLKRVLESLGLWPSMPI